MFPQIEKSVNPISKRQLLWPIAYSLRKYLTIFVNYSLTTLRTHRLLSRRQVTASWLLSGRLIDGVGRRGSRATLLDGGQVGPAGISINPPSGTRPSGSVTDNATHRPMPRADHFFECACVRIVNHTPRGHPHPNPLNGGPQKAIHK